MELTAGYCRFVNATVLGSLCCACQHCLNRGPNCPALTPLSVCIPVLFVLQCGILPYAGVDICLFELLKDKLLEKYDGDPPHAAIVGGGMVSSSIAQFVSYPLALVRTRLQVGDSLGSTRKREHCSLVHARAVSG